jgi:murein DD-endopeptidase MepM/ murein hydrolase activator NlpD
VLLVVGLLVLPPLAERLRGRPHMPTYGLMLHPYGAAVRYQTCGFHTGQDWFGPVGMPVFAVEPGEVVYVGPLWARGEGVGRGDHAIVLDHGDYYTTYSHNRAALVEVGDRVERGQRIAELGDEGYSGAPHLHLEMVLAPFTGDWQRPFDGCAGYVDPGGRWSPF